MWNVRYKMWRPWLASGIRKRQIVGTSKAGSPILEYKIPTFVKNPKAARNWAYKKLPIKATSLKSSKNSIVWDINLFKASSKTRLNIEEKTSVNF